MSALSIVAVGLSLAAAAVAIVLLVAVLVAARHRTFAYAFALFAALLACWNLLIGLQAVPGAVDSAGSWLDALRYPAMLVPAAALHLVVAWSSDRGWTWSTVVAGGYVIGAALGILQFHGLIYDGWLVYSWGASGRAGPLAWLWIAFSATWLVLTPLAARRGMRTAADAEQRLRMRYAFIASCVAVPLSVCNFLANYGIPCPPLSGLASVLLASVLGYGAVRHRMLDLDVVVLRITGSLFAAAVVVAPLVVAAVWAQQRAFGHADPLASGAAGVALLGAVYAHSWAKHSVSSAIERSFFPVRYRARRAIETLSRSVLELGQRARLVDELTTTLGRELGLAAVGLYARNGAGRFAREGLWVAEESGHFDGVVELTDPAADAPLPWDLSIPIGTNGNMVGAILLGPKLSGAMIDDLDRTLITVVASQVGIALDNIDYLRTLEEQTAAIERQRDEIQRQKAAIEELQKKVEAENTVLRAEVRTVSGFGEIVGASEGLRQVLDVVERAAPSGISVLITGETGTGKELIARALHERSDRRHGPLINVNCPAIPVELAEAEFFGCERGAFTGAEQARPGRFELADGGTIFLDEVADLPYAIQTKLLRVLQEREVQRVGDTRVRRVDVRVVAATNRDLGEAMRRGAFREDLYHRLAAIHTHLPPLRERLDDLEMLATYFLDRAATTNQKPRPRLGAAAVDALRRYNWPGNIRELQNVIERAVLLCDGDALLPQHLGDLAEVAAPQEALGLCLRDEKRRRVAEALAASGGNVAAAARALGVSPSNLSRLMKKLGLARADFVK